MEKTNSNPGLFAIILEQKEEFLFESYVPELEIRSSGTNLEETLQNTRNDIFQFIENYLKQNKTLPIQINLNPDREENQILIIIDLNYENYRKSHSKKAVRKSISIPEWLDFQLSKNGLKLSTIVQDAVLKELGLDKMP